MDALDQAVATAVLGLDTLWGGDVMNPSGTGRFIADSWFSDEPLPASYTRPEAARLRELGGASAKAEAIAALDAYLAAPKKFVPGGKMKYDGLAGTAERANLLAYLATLR